ncbi:porin [Paraburkholderia sediminicola]|uniref:porin n=1 Tax=Paraburkholderia sediminicola TaxID=458836 RepID=UPI0038BB6600
MKFKLVAFAGFAIFFQNAAQAQSSVTLWGLIDEGMLYNSNANGHDRISMATMLTSSKFGFTGIEDLGNNYKIVFSLENGFNPATGAMSNANLAFGKRTYIGLSSPFGTLLAGRQYSAILDWVKWFSVNQSFAGGLPGLYMNDVDDVGGDIHFNNTIKYKSPDYNGFGFGGQYSMNSHTDSATSGTAWGVGTAYVGSNFGAGAAFQHIGNPQAYAAFQNNATYTNVYYGRAITLASGWNIAAAGVFANYKALNVQFLYSRVNFYLPSGKDISVFNNYQLGFNYSLTPAIQAAAFYVYSNVSQAGEGGFNNQHFGVVGHYLLSKSTDLYAIAMGILAHGNVAGAQAVGQPASSASRQFLAGIGIRKKF